MILDAFSNFRYGIDDDLEQSMVDFLATEQGVSVARDLANSYMVHHVYQEGVLANVNEDDFLKVYKECIEDARVLKDTPWENIVEANYRKYIEDSDFIIGLALHNVHRARSDIAFKGRTESMMTNEFLYQAGKQICEAYEDSDNSIDFTVAKEMAGKALSAVIDSGFIGEDGMTLFDMIVKQSNWKEFVCDNNAMVEFVLNLNQKHGEWLDDSYIYNLALHDIYENSVLFYRRVLPILNISGDELLDQMKEFICGDEECIKLISEIKKHGDHAPIFSAESFVKAIVDHGGDGNAILFGKVSSEELLDADPREPIIIKGDLKIGMHDYMTDNGVIESIDAEEVFLPAGSLLNYEFCGQGSNPRVAKSHEGHADNSVISMCNEAVMTEKEEEYSNPVEVMSHV